jgi:enoyl-CoA hydratase/carnithine racemase
MTKGWEFTVAPSGVGTVTFDRPEVLNALTIEVYAAYRDLLERLRSDESVKALVVTGRGRGFCSGGDVHEIIGRLLDADVKAHLEFTRMTGATIRNMRLLEKPIVAAINGVAAGAGAVIALAADLRVMSSAASFHFLFTKVGLSGADMGAAYLLPRVVGLGRATEALLLGDAVDATRAEAWGLANQVVPPENPPPPPPAPPERLAAGPTLALGVTKRRIQSELSMDLVSALESEAEAQALLMMAGDHRRFHEAYLRGAEADFRGT